jgi:hypothetical protein
MPLFDAYTINNTGLVNAIVQNVVESPLNSSTATLAPTGTFTGTGTSTLGVAGIQVSLYANQNCTVYVEQSPDNTNWDISDSYDYKYQTRPNFGTTIQAVSSYFRVRVTNNSQSASATTFRLQSCLCPVVEAIPRSLDSYGFLQTCVESIEDRYGSQVKLSPVGGLNTTKLNRLVGVTFSGTTIDSNFWQASAVSGASAVQVGGELSLNTNAATTGACCYLNSIRSARYIPANNHYVRFQLDCGSTTGTGTIKRWGAWTSSAVGSYNAPQDGCAFTVYNGVLALETFNNGSATRIDNGAFNGSYGLTVNVPPSGISLYEMVYTNSAVWFIYNGNYIHKVSATAAPWSSTLTLPVRAEIYNASATAFNTSIKIRSASISRYGEVVDGTPIWYAPTAAASGVVLKRGAGRLQKIINYDSAAGTLNMWDGVTTAAPSIALVTAFDLSKVTGSLTHNVDFYSGLTISCTRGSVMVVYE